jgi:YegS/Rv2252/BmrU family lipid kinase
MSRNVCLIVNPAAGGGRAGRVAPEVEQALRDHGLFVRRVDTRDLDHARALGRGAAMAGETVVALSGDGLLGVLADVLREVDGAVLGVLPGGRGNDFARVLGIHEDPVAACTTIAHGVPRAIDLGLVIESNGVGRGRAFVGIASLGFDSDANRFANEAPAWLGALVYAYGALRTLLSWRPAEFDVELGANGERHAFSGYSVAAANSRAYGGGMMLAPGAMLDDGMLDVVAIEHVGRLRFLMNLPRVFRGSHVGLPTVTVFRAAEVEVSADRRFVVYADGDPIGELPVRVSALPAAITMLVPADHGSGGALSPHIPQGVEQRPHVENGSPAPAAGIPTPGAGS